jgi:hypothetical protein
MQVVSVLLESMSLYIGVLAILVFSCVGIAQKPSMT